MAKSTLTKPLPLVVQHILCLTIITLLMGGLGAFVWSGANEAELTQDWRETRGTIRAIEVTDVTGHRTGPKFRVTVAYDYSVDDARYVGSKYYASGNIVKGGEARTIRTTYARGSTIAVYYDPADPHQAVLARQSGAETGRLIAYGLWAVPALCWTLFIGLKVVGR